MRLQSYERRNTEHRVPLHIVGASVVKGCEGYTEGEVEELALKVDAGVSVEVQGVPGPRWTIWDGLQLVDTGAVISVL